MPRHGALSIRTPKRSRDEERGQRVRRGAVSSRGNGVHVSSQRAMMCAVTCAVTCAVMCAVTCALMCAVTCAVMWVVMWVAMC